MPSILKPKQNRLRKEVNRIDNLNIYDALKQPPKEALRTI
ncbi:unnamed protein product, partial [marine sediment metagenome]